MFSGIIEPIDTTKWPIDYSDPRSIYLYSILSAAYATGVISTNETIPGDVLIIGLGGGSSNNYFRHATENVISCFILAIKEKQWDYIITMQW